jgi:hypothetical protein
MDQVEVNDGSGAVNVSTTSACNWAAASNAAWMTISSGSTGTGNGRVEYRFAGNVSGQARTGTLTIGGLTFTVVQAGCTYSLSHATDEVQVNDGSGAVNVSTTSSCGWTAASNAAWMTISSGSTGTGNGRVEYRFAGNVSGQTRTGTLTIAGRTFTIVQAAIPGASDR